MPSGRAAFALVLLTGLLLGRGADDAGASAAEGAGAAFALVVLAGADEAGASCFGVELEALVWNFHLIGFVV